MPSLEFKGKQFIYTHHLSVPFRELVPDKKKSVAPQVKDGDLNDNLVIHGDNLEALKALLPTYAGKVDCIYIDPPYNTGSEGWCYNDKVNSPLMREWIKKSANPVDKEDLERHDKWLCMMWPRLKLLHELLSEDGSIFVSIDDNEQHRLRAAMDEVFGAENFLACVVWEKGKKGDPKFFSETHEYILVYGKNRALLVRHGVRWKRGKEGLDEIIAQYSSLRSKHGKDHAAIREGMMSWYRGLPDDAPSKAHKHYNWSDDRGLYFAADFAGPDDDRESRPRYDIIHPITKKPCAKPSTGWRWEEPRTLAALQAKPPLIHFGPDETTIPNRKTYLENADEEAHPTVIYRDGRAATLTVEQIMGKGAFQFPKDTDVLQELLALATDEDSLILDSFGGSGTTAHAVLAMNQKDGGNRRFILIECEDYADKLTAERVRRVINGYTFKGTQRTELLREKVTLTTLKKAAALLEKADSIEMLEGSRFDRVKREVKDGTLIVTGEKDVKEKTEGLGGSFTFCTLGKVMDLESIVRGEGELPDYESLARYVFFTATGRALDTVPKREPDGFIGSTDLYNLHLHYQPDRTWLRGSEAQLHEDHVKLITARKPPGKKALVFAVGKYMSQKSLTPQSVEFCQLPYAIHRMVGG